MLLFSNVRKVMTGRRLQPRDAGHSLTFTTDHGDKETLNPSELVLVNTTTVAAVQYSYGALKQARQVSCCTLFDDSYRQRLAVTEDESVIAMPQEA